MLISTVDDRKIAARRIKRTAGPALDTGKRGAFELVGRPALERFLNEHVIDIVENAARYKSFGVEVPQRARLARAARLRQNLRG